MYSFLNQDPSDYADQHTRGLCTTPSYQTCTLVDYNANQGIQDTSFVAPKEEASGKQVANVNPTDIRTQSAVGSKVNVSNKTSKKSKKPANTSNIDTSSFSIEERLVAAVWVHERQHTRSSMSKITHDFHQRFGKDAPARNTLLAWEKKLFTTGSVFDAPRTGRPVIRTSRVSDVAASLQSAPSLSLRARAAALRLSRSTLHNILKGELANMQTDAATASKKSKKGVKIKQNQKKAQSPPLTADNGPYSLYS